MQTTGRDLSPRPVLAGFMTSDQRSHVCSVQRPDMTT
jgi:hypothetical protein